MRSDKSHHGCTYIYKHTYVPYKCSGPCSWTWSSNFWSHSPQELGRNTIVFGYKVTLKLKKKKNAWHNIPIQITGWSCGWTVTELYSCCQRPTLWPEYPVRGQCSLPLRVPGALTSLFWHSSAFHDWNKFKHLYL